MKEIRENWRAYGRFIRAMHELEQDRQELNEKWDELYRDILRALAPYSYRAHLRLYLSLTLKPIKKLWRRINLATNW